jgi:hypothetical protein
MCVYFHGSPPVVANSNGTITFTSYDYFKYDEVVTTYYIVTKTVVT